LFETKRTFDNSNLNALRFLPSLVLLVSLNERLGKTLFKDASIDEHTADEVWIDIGGRSSVLDVALAVGMSSGCGDAERGGSVSYTVRESVHG